MTFPDAWTTACNCGQGTFRIAGPNESSSDIVEGVAVYPNPFSDVPLIALGRIDRYHTVQLSDLQGRLMCSAPIAPDMARLDMNLSAQSLAAGIYIVQRIGDGYRVQRKL